MGCNDSSSWDLKIQMSSMNVPEALRPCQDRLGGTWSTLCDADLPHCMQVYVTAGGRKQLTGAAAHKAYERDKRAAGSFAINN